MAGVADLKIEPASPSPPEMRGRLASLLRKGSLAVADQALFSGANFLVNVLLARDLAPEEYGAYSLAYAWFLLFAALHQSLLIEPMMIFGAGKYFEQFPRYLLLLIGIHTLLLAPLGLFVWGVAALFGRLYFSAARGAFEGMALATTMILLFWLLRRVFYILMKPGWAVISSTLYLVALGASVGGLAVNHALTPATGFLAMGLAGLLVSGLVLWRVAPRRAPGGASTTLRAVAADHWRYGRWALCSAVASWFPSNIYYVLLSAWLGLQGAAGLRALTNLIMPVIQGVTALNMLMLPILVRDLRSGGIPKMNQTMAVYLKVQGAGCAAYLLVLWLFRDHVFQLVYGGRYRQYEGWPLLLAGALPIANCIYSVLGNALRAMERPDRMLLAFLGSSAAAALFGIPLTAGLGVSGALLGNYCSAVVFIAILWWQYTTLRRQPAEADGCIR